MGDKETPFSLFSSSGKKPPNKKSGAGSPPVSKSPKAAEPTFDPVTQEIFDKINMMQKDILGKLDKITQASGMSREDILKMLQGPSGTRPELDKMNADLQAFTEKVKKALGDGILPKTGPSVKGVLTEKDRKGKTLGARRQWLRMP